MKKSKIIIAIILLASFAYAPANAQLKDWLNTKKQEAKTKAQNKLDQKSSAGIDKAVDAPETAIKKKKDKKEQKKAGANTVDGNNNTTTTTGSSEPSTESTALEGEGAQTVIQTNILCDKGKKKVESALKKHTGVLEVKTNTKNGELSIRYTSGTASYSSILQIINAQGFEADGNEPTSDAPKNPCK